MKVLLAVDDSPYSKQVVDSILKRRWPERTKFKVLTVLEPLGAPAKECGADFADSLSQIHERRQAAARHLCEKICRRITSIMPAADAHFEIREGLPHQEIINASVEWPADSILVGAHGRNVCPQELLSSVSRTVVNHAPCSVEIVREHSKQLSAGR